MGWLRPGSNRPPSRPPTLPARKQTIMTQCRRRSSRSSAAMSSAWAISSSSINAPICGASHGVRMTAPHTVASRSDAGVLSARLVLAIGRM
jgi:hypothetical protein